MATTNQFLPFGTAGGAPVMDNTTWAATVPANGFPAGLVAKEKMNKALRQGSVMAAAIGQFINSQGFDALDDGNVPALMLNLEHALTLFINAVVAPSTGLIDPGSNQAAIPVGGVVAGQTHGALIASTAVLGVIAFTVSNYITTLDASLTVFTNIQYGTWRFLGSQNSSYGLWLRIA